MYNVSETKSAKSPNSGSSFYEGTSSCIVDFTRGMEIITPLSNLTDMYSSVGLKVRC
jgi:hypothetical protein